MWSAKIPTKDGYYWCKDEAGYITPVSVSIGVSDSIYVTFIGNDSDYSPKDLTNCQFWSIPLEEPK